MVAITKVISAVVLASVAVLLHLTTPVDALCLCPAWDPTLTDYANAGAVVLRAKVLFRSYGTDDKNNDVIYYKVRATTVYAGGADIEYSKKLYFTTSTSGDYDCRVNLSIGGDYLLSLFYTTTTTSSSSSSSYSSQGGALTASACDLHNPWSSVSQEWKRELAELLERDEDDDEDE